jgi:hypothetical protein
LFIDFLKERKWLVFSLLIVAVYLAPLFILQENAHIRVHDNLDSNIAWYKVLARSGQILGPVQGIIPQILNGLPRNALGSEYSGIVWLYAFFPTMTAYGMSQAVTRIVAIFGMYLLLKKHLLPENKWRFYQIGAALAFSITPFWPSGMLSTLGMPLALWAFLNIRKGEEIGKSFLALTLLPFYSSFVLGFFFFLSAIGLFWLSEVFRGKGWNIRFFAAIIYMTAIYMLVEYRLVFSFLYIGEPNSRDEYSYAQLPLWRVIHLTFKNYFLGHTHDTTVHTLIVLPITFFALYYVWKKQLWEQEKVFLSIFILNFLLSVWYAFWFYKGWAPITERFHFLKTFNFARYHFLSPFLIYVDFALALKILSSMGRSWRKTVKTMVALQVAFLFLYNDEIIYHQKPTVREFYAEELFSEIK